MQVWELTSTYETKSTAFCISNIIRIDNDWIDRECCLIVNYDSRVITYKLAIKLYSIVDIILV